MVKVEMIYNPYLLETEIRFNGNPPRINSLVDKYKHEKLQTWVNEIPSIFHDEMNGYDFDLDFTGTALDFEEVKQAFERAGVNNDSVRLFYKGELRSRQDKVIAIDNLMKWLHETSNNQFDIASFWEKKKGLFEDAYSFVVIGKNIKPDHLFDDLDVAIEHVESVDELRNTDLKSTPILMYLDHKTDDSLQHNLIGLLNRSDIIQEQLFFIISPELVRKTQRVIQDLGVREPQIVASVNDPLIRKYLEIFPVSDYIHEVIQALRVQEERISPIIQENNRKSAAANKDIHSKIQEYDSILERLKSTNDLFANRDNLDLPMEFTKAKFGLAAAINRWKIKKTKITDPDEAWILAHEYQDEVRQQFDRFVHIIYRSYARECEKIQKLCDDWYQSSELLNSSEPPIKPKRISEYVLPEFYSDLLEIKTENYVEPKEALIGKLFKSSQDDDALNMVLETTYYYEKWRAYAIHVLEPYTEGLIRESYMAMQEYYNQLSNFYMQKINTILKQVNFDRETVSSNLSAEERILQTETDWLTTFNDMLRSIERS